MRGGCATGGGWGGLRSGMGVPVSGASVLDALGDHGWSLGLGVLLSLGSSGFLGREHFVLAYKKKLCKGHVKLIKRVKIAHSFLQSVSNQFHFIILSFLM